MAWDTLSPDPVVRLVAELCVMYVWRDRLIVDENIVEGAGPSKIGQGNVLNFEAWCQSDLHYEIAQSLCSNIYQEVDASATGSIEL